jgi:hypothetical protein
VGLPSIELAPLACPDNFLCIAQRRWLVETLAKVLANQQPWGGVMAADASMDLQEEFFALLGQNALHQHSDR